MSEELQQRMRRDLGALDQVPVSSPTDVRGRTARQIALHSARRERRRQVGMLTGVGVLMTIGVVGLVWARAGDPTTVPVAAPPTATVTSTAPPSTNPVDTGPGISTPYATTPLDTAPSSANTVPAGSPAIEQAAWEDVWGTIAVNGRIGTGSTTMADPLVVVWTGTEALVVGPNLIPLIDTFGSAAAYHPTDDSWRELARPPVSTAGDEIAVWTGIEMLLVGGSEGVALAYNPATDAWRELATGYGVTPMGHMIGGERGTPYVWTGSELLVWSVVGDGANVQGLHAYDPAADEWRAIAAPPDGFYRRSAAASVWTGTEWLLWGGTERRTDGTSVEFADGAAYNPSTDTWRVLADSPLSERRTSAVWTGTEMLIIAGSSGGIDGNGEMALADSAAYDPVADTWRPLRSGIAHPGLQPVWTGEYVITFFKGTAGVYHPATDTWIDSCCNVGGGARRTHVWTGESVISFVGQDTGHGGTTFTPPPKG